MQAFYFAQYRLLIDDDLIDSETAVRLTDFKKEMPYIHTFMLRQGDSSLLHQKFDEAIQSPTVCKVPLADIHSLNEEWILTLTSSEISEIPDKKLAIYCSDDYSDMTLYMSHEPYYIPSCGRMVTPAVPFASFVSIGFNSGIVRHGGMVIHSSMVEKDGAAVVFLGASGIGKSTQAKCWQQYLHADFINGDRPALCLMDGGWFACGMPWDGKDRIFRQQNVPVKAFISLEQTPENRITKLDPAQSMAVLLKQAVMPMWDDTGMNLVTDLMWQLANDVPFYHLKNRADEDAALLAYNTIYCEE